MYYMWGSKVPAMSQSSDQASRNTISDSQPCFPQLKTKRDCSMTSLLQLHPRFNSWSLKKSSQKPSRSLYHKLAPLIYEVWAENQRELLDCFGTSVTQACVVLRSTACPMRHSESIHVKEVTHASFNVLVHDSVYETHASPDQSTEHTVLSTAHVAIVIVKLIFSHISLLLGRQSLLDA